jgi:hypothetical protein
VSGPNPGPRQFRTSGLGIRDLGFGIFLYEPQTQNLVSRVPNPAFPLFADILPLPLGPPETYLLPLRADCIYVLEMRETRAESGP